MSQHQRNNNHRHENRRRDEDREREPELTREQENLHSISLRSESTGKKFFLDLRENDRGRFLRIKEVNGGRVEMVMIPDDCLDGIANALDEMARHA